MATTWTLRLMVAVSLALSGCTLMRVDGPAFSGLTTVNPPCVCPCPVPVPGVVRPSGIVPAS